MKRTLAALVLALAATSVFAQLRVRDAWVGATAAGQKSTGAFMELTSAEDLKLVGVRSPIAGHSEIQQMADGQEATKMRTVPYVALPANQPVALDSDLHVMLFDVKQVLKIGDVVPLTLLLQRGDGATGSMDVKVQVRPASAGHAHAHDY
jgi:copper(I)-binding protein